MSPQERAGMAAAINEAIANACAAVRREYTEALEGLHRSADQAIEALTQRAERAEERADQLQRDINASRELASQPGILRALVDAEGVLHIVQRNGDTLTVRLADESQRIAAAVTDSSREAELRINARLDGQVARAMQELGLAPEWSRVAAYAPGSVVSCYIGRSYRLRDGVKASMGQEPGEHPDVWERIGVHGLRVLKSRPAQLVAGDVFTESEARFIFDGVATTLLSPKAVKPSDVERAIKPVHALAQSAMEQTRQAHSEIAATRRDLEGIQAVARRADQAANDAKGWINNEGDAAVVRSAKVEAWCENRALLIDSPALARIVERADDLDNLLDQEAG